MTINFLLEENSIHTDIIDSEIIFDIDTLNYEDYKLILL